jgi:hypothetical protein
LFVDSFRSIKEEAPQNILESGIDAVTVTIKVNVSRGIQFILAGCKGVFIAGGNNLTMSYRVWL